MRARNLKLIKKVINSKKQFYRLRIYCTFIAIINYIQRKLVVMNKQVKINFYYRPRQLIENALILDNEQMTQLWQKVMSLLKQKIHLSSVTFPP